MNTPEQVEERSPAERIEEIFSAFETAGAVGPEKDVAYLFDLQGEDGGQFLLKVSRALAYYAGRDYVVPDDIKEAAPHVLGHRMMLRKQTSISDAHRVISEILAMVPVPV